MKKRLFNLALFLLFSLAFACPGEATTVRISNPKIELELAPGESVSGEIVVENPDGESVNLKVYPEDWQYTPGGTGEKKFSPAGTTPLSASPWISFSPSETVLPPFGKVTARYTATMPADATGTHFSVLFFETILGSAKNDEGVNVLVAGRIGALFFLQTKGTIERKGEVTSVKITPPEGNKPLGIETTFTNSGNVDIALGGNLLIMDAQGVVQGRGELVKIYTFPGATESRQTQWVGRLPKGAYDLLLTYDLGQGKTQVKEEKFSVS